MAQKIRTVKEFLKEKEKLDKTVMHWEASGLLEGLDKEGARALAELLETLATMYISRPIGDDIAATLAFPIARMCFVNLNYLIQNAHKFVSYLDVRVKQEEAIWNQVNVSRIQEMGMEAELCATIANEVKAMKL
jgi:hypothetical protein